MKQIGTYAGVPVSLEWRDGPPADPQAGQVIVFTIPRDLLGTGAWFAIAGLGYALGCGRVHSRAISKQSIRMEIHHTDEIDQRIMTLIDLLITARYEHPTIVQLAIQLEPTEAAELETALS